MLEVFRSKLSLSSELKRARAAFRREKDREIFFQNIASDLKIRNAELENENLYLSSKLSKAKARIDQLDAQLSLYVVYNFDGEKKSIFDLKKIVDTQANEIEELKNALEESKKRFAVSEETANNLLKSNQKLLQKVKTQTSKK